MNNYVGLIQRILFTLAVACIFLTDEICAQYLERRVCSDEETICIISEEFGSIDSIIFTVENLSPFFMTVTIELEMENLISSEPDPFTDVFNPRARTRAFRLVLDNCEIGHWEYGSNFFEQYGSLKAVHNDSVIYQLPYRIGEKFKVVQAYGGVFSHQGERRYAIDFAMPEGTPVCAAREGIIIKSVDKFQIAKKDSAYIDSANVILIGHDDGTVARYGHLRYKGVLKNVGERVAMGEVIGFSGNTGYSTGPHLHFEVYKPVDGRHRETIPVRFKSEEGDKITLQSGYYYTSE